MDEEHPMDEDRGDGAPTPDDQRARVRATFDATDTGAATEDTFLIYLVDPSDPSRTLIDRGTPGATSRSGEP